MKPDRKPASSKLWPFRAELLALNDAGKKLDEIQQWLKSRGPVASTSCISNLLTRLRTERAVAVVPNRQGYSLPYYPKLQNKFNKMRARALSVWRGSDGRSNGGRAGIKSANWPAS